MKVTEHVGLECAQMTAEMVAGARGVSHCMVMSRSRRALPQPRSL